MGRTVTEIGGQRYELISEAEQSEMEAVAAEARARVAERCAPARRRANPEILVLALLDTLAELRELRRGQARLEEELAEAGRSRAAAEQSERSLEARLHYLEAALDCMQGFAASPAAARVREKAIRRRRSDEGADAARRGGARYEQLSFL